MNSDWNQHFMKIAEVVSERGTCLRKKVGAIIVKDKRIIASGYNGAISGTENCTEVGCLMEEGHCVRTLHSELNTILQLAKYGISGDEAFLYCTAFPCWNCFKAIANSGIVAIYYKELYHPDDKILKKIVPHVGNGGIKPHYLDGQLEILVEQVKST